MQVDRSNDGLTLTLGGAEVQLLRKALKRATFEDTEPAEQREILDFALALIRALGEEG